MYIANSVQSTFIGNVFNIDPTFSPTVSPSAQPIFIGQFPKLWSQYFATSWCFEPDWKLKPLRGILLMFWLNIEF